MVTPNVAAQPVPPELALAGSTVVLSWQATPDWQFNFTLIYTPEGRFTMVLCEIRARKLDFHGNNYYLPLRIATTDSGQQDVRIDMRMAAGSGGYAGAVWCVIGVPGFQFQGNAFEFSDNASGPPPLTVW